ncbi:hypothetical protein PYW08_000686 [Mythimna loreyi]|uniref:Uncharacterized protein n=1 Tax=Mythimna loreyi TaxID=667449 RepID=A0ACC2R0Y1_9NEOP|nr:hypothetical protein PYW08_000686 [Mythimna loreyi]
MRKNYLLIDISKRVFTKSNDYKGLEDALAALVSDCDDDEEYELVTIPPEPSCLTDEEEGDKHELVQNDLPRDVPGQIEVFVRKNLDHTPQWDEDDDEPLSTLQRKRPRVEDQEPRWHKCQPTYDVFYGAGVSPRHLLHHKTGKCKISIAQSEPCSNMREII